MIGACQHQTRRVRILRNNNTHFDGLVFNVSQRMHPTLVHLLEAVTKSLNNCAAVRLPTPVTQLRRRSGALITDVRQLLQPHADEEIEDGGMPSIVACCQYEKLTRVVCRTSKPLANVPRRRSRKHRTVCPSSYIEDMPIWMLMPRQFRYTYEAGRLLPSGQAGAVMLMQHQATKKMAVLKVMEVTSETCWELNESRLLGKLQHQHHPQILNLMEVKQTHRAVYIMMEAMDMDLDMFQKTFKLESRPLMFIVKRIICGLRFIHRQNIAHRDIKLKNILVRLNMDSPKMPISELKIADFGLACTCAPDKLMYDIAGTRKYFAPEILDGRGYTKTVDCYSAGVAFHKLATCTYPTNFNEIADSTIDNFPEWPLFCDLMSHMLEPSPSQRWCSWMLSMHEFVANPSLCSRPSSST